MPTNIRLQMPALSALLQSLAASIGRERVQAQLLATVEIRRAFDADDYQGVKHAYGKGHGWVNAQENGYCMGVPDGAMAAFAKRHRRPPLARGRS